MEGLIGMIKMYVVPQGPADWMLCDGSVQKVVDFPKLFGIIGNRFGGDGEATFALPHLDAGQGGFFMVRVNSTEAEDAAFKGTLSQVVLYAAEGLPEGWVDCAGQVLKHTDFPALSQLMGTEHANDEHFLLPTVPPVGEVRYIICIEGIDPTADEDDDDDY